MIRRARASSGAAALDGPGGAARLRAPPPGRCPRGSSRRGRCCPTTRATPERPLIDRLVRLGVAPRGRRAPPDRPTSPRGASTSRYWLGRAFDLASKRPSGAFGDVPDSVQVWVDGIARARHRSGATAQGDELRAVPARHDRAPRSTGASARRARRATRSRPSAAATPAFWRGLLTGLSASRASRAAATWPTGGLTRAQWLGMVANLRYPQVRVLETTDFHGAILGGTRDRRSGRAIGGTVGAGRGDRAAYAPRTPRARCCWTAATSFQGTMISNLQYGRPVVEQMDLLGYAAPAIGNHDFDWSADTLARGS